MVPKEGKEKTKKKKKEKQGRERERDVHLKEIKKENEIYIVPFRI